MATTPIRFFSPATKLGVLEADIQELEASAHAPPVSLERAKQALAEIRGMYLRTHECALQVSMGQTVGNEQHQRTWQAKISDIEQSITDATAQLHTIVDELRVEQFRRYWSIVKAQRAVLHYLFTVSKVDGLPPIARHYLRETAFISKVDGLPGRTAR